MVMCPTQVESIDQSTLTKIVGEIAKKEGIDGKMTNYRPYVPLLHHGCIIVTFEFFRIEFYRIYKIYRICRKLFLVIFIF